MSAALTVAAVQVTAGREIAPNLDKVSTLVRTARARGADMVFLPENVAMMDAGPGARAKAQPEETHVGVQTLQALARELGIWLHGGTLAVALDDGRLANRTYVLDPTGAIRARYDKIHMFDVDLPGGERHRESATYRPGSTAVVVDTPWVRLGLTICYDLRFAALFRCLAQAGAGVIAVPAAFTRTTGQAHWHVLLRARAIETGCFIVAPAQTGDHEDGRKTFGHALIVTPWGEVLADAGTEEGIIVAGLDLERVDAVRGMIPALRHDRAFSLSAP
ncbi:carbon-nitrogen hydrolase family protein [Pararhodospirillum photometricum]|uniref:Nitrilase/cyanide hydratase and apolipoprotein N-acyltransferase n=1 Tax=Pararhodospirillum photometricum DSM 122 TaxID=1150469 RepID=H6SJD8_PARPM|nr:carbon-nitrogen hydrolase family protein [Pararhodospirillum photometricum]CCG08103.1 Nitrilase/cyanide hydratase and apolipoprotein N-acyltransferase [Pararhodospirillum photometricum DSM 122]